MRAEGERGTMCAHNHGGLNHANIQVEDTETKQNQLRAPAETSSLPSDINPSKTSPRELRHSDYRRTFQPREETEDIKEEIEDIKEENSRTRDNGEKEESSKNKHAYRVETAGVNDKPRTFDEAVHRPEGDLWQADMLEKLRASRNQQKKRSEEGYRLTNLGEVF
ncbi:hypothetical protein K503DRAFT_788145 [Rhizopogon vinicolor AM-OR11-026]|uniref:Uncharacterized protein n=1 Tax=Rhizopogon vinicolor AM-OR11-026 TaxID=1314800 RepID=A0A1B7MEC5_9AGAM|nr:hypothetical protein K503DRAFT_788145 [Rhizopogon vinicolor AM-OR11-026]